MPKVNTDRNFKCNHIITRGPRKGEECGRGAFKNKETQKCWKHSQNHKNYNASYYKNNTNNWKTKYNYYKPKRIEQVVELDV
jgi:hypothetical protein